MAASLQRPTQSQSPPRPPKACEKEVKRKAATTAKTTSKKSASVKPKMTKKQKLALETEAKVKGQRDLAKLAAGN